MSIRIASWNIEGRLSLYDGSKKRGTPPKILAEIARLDADIVVLPEAYLDAPAKGVNERLSQLGYKWYDTQYHDTMHEADVARWGHPFMRVLYRISLETIETRRWGDMRDLPLLTYSDPKSTKRLHILPIHLDDITEERRLKQVDAIVSYLTMNNEPVVMLGDFNAMWREDWRKLLASQPFRRLLNVIPHKELRFVLLRLSRMATGEVMKQLMTVGMREADPSHRPTTTPKMRSMPHMPSVRLMQIDHILTRGVSCTPVVIGKDGGSDHRSLSATISF